MSARLVKQSKHKWLIQRRRCHMNNRGLKVNYKNLNGRAYLSESEAQENVALNTPNYTALAYYNIIDEVYGGDRG